MKLPRHGKTFLLFAFLAGSFLALSCQSNSFPRPPALANTKGLRKDTSSEKKKNLSSSEASSTGDSQFLQPTLKAEDLRNIASPVLSAGDKIRIEVLGEKDLTSTFTIPSSGILYYPLLKKIQIGGKTLEDLREEMVKKLSEYLVNPLVNISVIEWSPDKKIYFYYAAEGQLEGGSSLDKKRSHHKLKALDFPASGKITASRFLIQIGLPKEADLNQIYILRRKPKSSDNDIIRISLEEIFLEETFAKDVFLQPEDIVVVKSKEKVFVQGEVGEPGIVYIENRKKLDLWSLILKAGGPKASADLNRIRIIRQGKEGEQKIEVVSAFPQKDKNLYIRPRDVIIVPSQAENVVTIYGEIKKPGTVKIKSKNMRLSTVIALAGGVTEFASNSIYIFRYLPDGRTRRFSIDFSDITSGEASQDLEVKPGDVIYIPSSIF